MFLCILENWQTICLPLFCKMATITICIKNVWQKKSSTNWQEKRLIAERNWANQRENWQIEMCENAHSSNAY
jgi:hypothetical protein